jgi:hypothetical protein
VGGGVTGEGGGGRTAVVARSRGHRVGVTGWTTCGARRGTILHLLAGHGRRRGRGIGGFLRCGEPQGLRPGVTRGGASGVKTEPGMGIGMRMVETGM